METFWGIVTIILAVLTNIISNLTYNERYHSIKLERDIKYGVFNTSIITIWLSVVLLLVLVDNGFYIGFWYCILVALAVPFTWIGFVIGRNFYRNLLTSMLPNLIKKINKGIDLALIFKNGLFERTKKLVRETSHNNEEIKRLEALVADLSQQVAILPGMKPLAVLVDASVANSGNKPASRCSRYSSNDPGIRAMEDQLSDI